MKAVLVIDMPTHCGECPVKCRMRGINHVPTWCPLRPLPEESYKEEICNDQFYLCYGFQRGWNAFREEILGEKQNESSNCD